jgi:4-amino-4-deoxy-L-arabinose transferase-like glycosyltransferase
MTGQDPRAGAPDGSPPRWLIAFLLAMTAVRLAAAAAAPLTEDEAYYRLWAASLQLGYYDHPPMIAWWIRAGMSLAGDNAFGIRLIPSLASGLTGLLVFDLAGRLGADRATAARASVWYNATLLAGIGGAIATPDAAATPFWVLTLWCLTRTGGAREVRWWLAAGAAAGLACLSKYSSLFIAPGVLIWLAVSPGGLKRLAKPGPWAAAAIATALFGLNVAWNAQHHWVTLDKQFGRLAPHALKPQYLVELIVGQFLLLNPLIAIFAVRGLGARATPGRLNPRLLLATSAPFALYLAIHALHDRVQAHWPAPIYPALAIIAAAAAERAPAGWLSGVRAAAAPVGLSLSAVVLAHLALPATDIAGINDPTGALRGWPTFARTVDRLRQTHGAAWIGTLSYGATAQLDAARVSAPVVEIDERDRYLPGDASWRADLGRPGLIVDLKRRFQSGALEACVAQVTPLGDLIRRQGVSRPDRYAAYLVERPRQDVLTDGCATRR